LSVLLKLQEIENQHFFPNHRNTESHRAHNNIKRRESRGRKAAERKADIENLDEIEAQMEAELQARRESLALSKELAAKKKLVTQHKGVRRRRKQGKALKGKGALPDSDTEDYVSVTAMDNQDLDGIQGNDVDADERVYWQPASDSDNQFFLASNSLLPPPQVDLAPELEPPSPSLQAAVGSIFGQLATDANTSDSSDIPTEAAAAAEAESTTEVMAAELPAELGRGHRAKTGSKKYGAEWEGY
jgi:hypothetical protein